MKINKVLSAVLTVSFIFPAFVFAAGGGSVITTDPTKHFDNKGKMPSNFTIELQNSLRKTLPFEDERDFAEAKKGFIAAPYSTATLATGMPTRLLLFPSRPVIPRRSMWR